MSTFFEKNMAVLKDKYPEIAEYYAGYKNSDGTGVVHGGVQNIEGKTVLTAQRGDMLFQLDSLYDSKTFLDLWFDGVNKTLKLDSKHIMYGLGNGMCARKFLSCTDLGNMLIVFEPSDSIFHTVIENFDITDILKNDRFRLVVSNVGSEAAFFKLLSQNIKYTDVTTAGVGLHLNYSDLFPEKISEFYKELDKAFDFAQLGNSFMEQRGKLINQNIKDNLKYFMTSKRVTDLENAMPDVPAIIVSAGPSLNKNIAELAPAKGKALIIAVDSAIRTVKKQGVDPDLIVAVDPRKDERFLGEDKCEGIPFATNVRTNAGIVREHKGLKFFDNTGDYFIQKYIDEKDLEFPEIETGGSVATTAFSLAHYMGCNPIILIGQDLAYTGDKTHAAESVDAVRTVEELDGNLIDIDVFGNPVKTSADMLRYKEWFERTIADNPDIKLYDATEGGAFIKGSTVMTLKEVIKKECTRAHNVKCVFEGARDLLEGDLKDDFALKMAEMYKHLSEDKEILRKLLLNYSKMLDMVNLNKYNSSGFATLSRKSNELLSEVEEDPIMDYVMNNCYDRTNSISLNVNNIKDNERDELKSVIDISTRYAEILKDSIEETESDIEEMVESLKSE